MSSLATQPVLQGIAARLGRLEPIAEIDELARDPDLVETMTHLGLSHYARSTADLFELALASCRQTLQQSGVPPEAVDGLVFATSSLSGEDDCRRGLRRMHGELELHGAHPLGLFGSECSNGPTAVRVALDMLLARRLRHVLIVLADRAPGGPRLMEAFVSVFSDGAASCLLSAAGQTGYALEAVELHAAPAMWDLSAGANRVAYLRAGMSGAAAAVDRCLRAAGVERSAIRRVITGNYNRSVLSTYASQLRFEQAVMFADNLPRFAHAYAADMLINLRTLRETGGLGDGERALLLGSGLNTWGALVVRALPAA